MQAASSTFGRRPTCTQSLLKVQSTTTKHHHRPSSRRAAAQAGKDSSGGSMVEVHSILKQHKLLLSSGFSYDQASLILQVSEQRKAASAHVLAAGNPELSSSSSSPPPEPTAKPEAAAAAADTSSTSGTDDGQSPISIRPVLKTLEERISFLELELLKQSLTTAAPQQQLPTQGITSSSSTKAPTSSSFSALNPAAAGSASLNAAAMAAINQWGTADGSMWRQQRVPPGFGNGAAGGSGIDMTSSSSGLGGVGVGVGGSPDSLLTVSAQLAAAAELGELDPEVFAIAEALAVRQGLAGLPLTPELTAGQQFALSPQQLQQQQQRRPSSIWGRSGAHRARPLSANAWGDGLYDPEYGRPLLTQQDLQDDVPYQPSGWAVAGTVCCVYLGVIVTFLAMCVGDVPY